MKRVIEILTLLPWLAPYALLAVGYLFLLYLSGLHFPLLLVVTFPVMMFIFVMLHSQADMTLDLECMYEDGWKAKMQVYWNCYAFSIFCTFPVILIFSGLIYLISFLID
jgi:hypothetical protein